VTTFSTKAALADARLQAGARWIGMQRRYFDTREYIRAKRETLDMSENRARGALFVHVPKCAGTTIARQVPITHGHRSAEFFKWRDPALFDSCFTFGITRNPYDRLVSAFHYLRSDQTSKRDGEWGRRNLSQFPDFYAFMAALSHRGERNRLLGWLHFLPQTYYLCDAGNRVLVDYVGKTETFSDDIEQINARTGLGIENQRQRAVSRSPYKEFYSNETARLVDQIYADDFRVFGYDTEHDF
tara:strand:+ start:269 stop:994 length:726 start_codon:yes stop_codon:yes gene_type:complete